MSHLVHITLLGETEGGTLSGLGCIDIVNHNVECDFKLEYKSP